MPLTHRADRPIRQFCGEKFVNFCENVVAVQKCANLDLGKCCEYSMYIQKPASIQPRTNPPKCWQSYSYIFSSAIFSDTNIIFKVLLSRPGRVVDPNERATESSESGYKIISPQSRGTVLLAPKTSILIFVVAIRKKHEKLCSKKVKRENGHGQ